MSVWRHFVFQTVGRSHLLSQYDGERSMAKQYRPVSLLSVVCWVFEKLVNNRFVDHLEKCGLLSDFRYGIKYSRPTADLLTVLSDRIARAFNMPVATLAVALNKSKAFDRVLQAGFLRKLKFYGNSGHVFDLFSSFLNAGVPQGYNLGPTLFLLSINDIPDDVICNIAIYADGTTLYSKCDQASDLWQQLELASKLDWGKKWLVDFSIGKPQLVSRVNHLFLF